MSIDAKDHFRRDEPHHYNWGLSLKDPVGRFITRKNLSHAFSIAWDYSKESITSAWKNSLTQSVE